MQPAGPNRRLAASSVAAVALDRHAQALHTRQAQRVSGQGMAQPWRRAGCVNATQQPQAGEPHQEAQGAPQPQLDHKALRIVICKCCAGESNGPACLIEGRQVALQRRCDGAAVQWEALLEARSWPDHTY